MRSKTFLILILLYTIAKLTIVDVTSSDCKSTATATDLHKFNNHVLKRRIRSVVFPNKAQLLLTPAFTKAVLDGRPRGLSYSVEFDMYSPLPDTIEGWKPNIFINKFKKQDSGTSEQSLKTSTRRENISQSYNESLADRMQEQNQRYVEDYDYYKFPFHKTEDSNTEFIRNPYRKSNNLQGFSAYFHKQPYLKEIKKRFSEFKSAIKENKDYTEQIELNYEYQRERERKQLLKQVEMFGQIFKFNMKSCVRRAMCELAFYFRSYGESVMADIVRLILFPSYSSNSLGRVESFSANYTKGNCKLHFLISCPYSIIDFLPKLKMPIFYPIL